MKYKFEYNKDKRQIEIEGTGVRVAKYHDRIPNMLVVDAEKSVGLNCALHVFDAIYSVHDIKFSKGEDAARMLGEFSFEPKNQNFLSQGGFSLGYNEYSDTIRVNETNHMVLTRNDGQWQFDCDSGAPQELVRKAFTRFHADKHSVTKSPEELLGALVSKEIERSDELGL